MSWTLSTVVLCGTLALFAVGTLGDQTFRFHETGRRISMLERVVGGRHRDNGLEEVGGAHDVTRKDENSCTPDSDEHYDRLDALECNEEYMLAVRKEIERSNCTNMAYSPDDYDNGETDSCAIFDERDGVNVSCSEECSYRVYIYLYCKYLGEEAVNIDRECGETVVGASYCSFNSKGFCYLINSSTYQTVYDECFMKDIVNDRSCSNECKVALEKFKDIQGCCVRLYFEDEDEDTSLSDLFSTCRIEIPEACNSFSPPEEFLDCAHDGDVHVSPTVFYSIVLIMLSLFNVL